MNKEVNFILELGKTTLDRKTDKPDMIAKTKYSLAIVMKSGYINFILVLLKPDGNIIFRRLLKMLR